MKTNILIADDEPNQLELMAYNLETSGLEQSKQEMVKMHYN